MEQYLLLAKRAKGRALVDLIQKATAEPGIFAFAELLDLPNVKEVPPMLVHPIQAASFNSCCTMICMSISSLFGTTRCLIERLEACELLRMSISRHGIICLAARDVRACLSIPPSAAVCLWNAARVQQ